MKTKITMRMEGYEAIEKVAQIGAIVQEFMYPNIGRVKKLR